MGQILFVVWRESVEALLVVGILHAWLTHGDRAARRGLPYLWMGVGLGLCVAFLLAGALVGFTEILSSEAQENFQIVMMLTACVLIVQMVLWLKRHGRTLKKEMEENLQKEVRHANWWGIALLAAIAVAREGSETVVFLYGLGFGQDTQLLASQWLAVLLGFGLALLTFYILQLGGKLFSWRKFFQVTEIMLLFLACGLFQSGLDKLIDREILPAGIDPLWNTSMILDDGNPFGMLVATLTGYRAHPSLMNVLAYLAFWAVVLRLRRNAQQTFVTRSQSA